MFSTKAKEPLQRAMSQVGPDWQPVRILKAFDTSRSLGWPPENRDVRPMAAWCEKFCRGGWAFDLEDATVATFHFERPRDAQEFAVRWFPYKCI
jgi:hypothetical protein